MSKLVKFEIKENSIYKNGSFKYINPESVKCVSRKNRFSDVIIEFNDNSTITVLGSLAEVIAKLNGDVEIITESKKLKVFDEFDYDGKRYQVCLGHCCWKCAFYGNKKACSEQACKDEYIHYEILQ